MRHVTHGVVEDSLLRYNGGFSWCVGNIVVKELWVAYVRVLIALWQMTIQEVLYNLTYYSVNLNKYKNLFMIDVDFRVYLKSVLKDAIKLKQYLWAIMSGQKFQYDESGGTFFYFLLSFLALLLVPATYYLWPRCSKPGLHILFLLFYLKIIHYLE